MKEPPNGTLYATGLFLYTYLWYQVLESVGI